MKPALTLITSFGPITNNKVLVSITNNKQQTTKDRL